MYVINIDIPFFILSSTNLELIQNLYHYLFLSLQTDGAKTAQNPISPFICQNWIFESFIYTIPKVYLLIGDWRAVILTFNLMNI